MAHIWTAPHKKGGDCIFHCVPPRQNVPTGELLTNWYKTMLDEGETKDVLHEYKVSVVGVVW